MMHTMNNQVACRPFESRSVTAQVRSGFATAAQKHTLTGLVVEFADAEGKCPVGSTVYVRSDQFGADWAGKEYELDGRKFVLVPVAQVALVELPPAPPRWTPSPTPAINPDKFGG